MVSNYVVAPGIGLTIEDIAVVFALIFWSVFGGVFYANGLLRDLSKENFDYQSWANIYGPFVLLAIYFGFFLGSVFIIKFLLLILDEFVS